MLRAENAKILSNKKAIALFMLPTMLLIGILVIISNQNVCILQLTELGWYRKNIL